MAAGSLLLVDPDAASAAFVQHKLAEDGYEVSIAASGKEGLISAWRDRPDLIVLELDLPDLDGIAFIERLRKDPRTERTRLIALTHRRLPEEAVQALGAGLDYYILKQPDAVDTLRRHLADTRPSPEAAQPREPGRLVGFLAAKGGAGTSSLCLNLASSLVRRARGRTLAALDLVWPFGSLGTLSAAEPRPDLMDLSEINPAELSTETLLARFPLLPGWGLRVIPAPADPGRAAAFPADRFPSLLQAFRSAFDILFLDLGVRLSPLAQLVSRQADLLVVVLTSDSLATPPTQRLLAHFEAEGIPAERLFLLSNRPLGLEDLTGPPLERLLGRPLDYGMPHFGRPLQQANYLHAPVHLRFPDEAAAHSLDDVAQAIGTRIASRARR